MSGLAALLAGRKTVGVYHWTSPMRTSDIRHCAEHAHWQCYVSFRALVHSRQVS